MHIRPKISSKSPKTEFAYSAKMGIVNGAIEA